MCSEEGAAGLVRLDCADAHEEGFADGRAAEAKALLFELPAERLWQDAAINEPPEVARRWVMPQKRLRILPDGINLAAVADDAGVLHQKIQVRV